MNGGTVRFGPDEPIDHRPGSDPARERTSSATGPTPPGTPVFRCQACGRRFVAAPKKGPVGEPERAVVRRLLAERVGVRALARITGRSRSWVQGFVNALDRDETPHDPGPARS